MDCENCGIDDGVTITWLDIWGNEHHDFLCEDCMLAWYDENKDDLATVHNPDKDDLATVHRDNLINLQTAIQQTYTNLVLDKVVNAE